MIGDVSMAASVAAMLAAHRMDASMRVCAGARDQDRSWALMHRPTSR
jgi:hypothetical protein